MMFPSPRAWCCPFSSAVVLLLTAACPGTPGGELEPGFVAAEFPEGPHLRLVANVEPGGQVEVELVGEQLGNVLGWAAHLIWRAEHLGPADALGEVDASALGDDVDVRSVLVAEDGRVRVGASRVNPSRSEHAIDAPVVLARLFLRPNTSAESMVSDLALDRVMVRRGDGSHVPVQAVGGEVTTTAVEGGAP